MSIISCRYIQRFKYCVFTLFVLAVSQTPRFTFGQIPDGTFPYSAHGQSAFVLDWNTRDFDPHPHWGELARHLTERRISTYVEGLQKGYSNSAEAARFLEVGAIEEANSSIFTAINSNLIYTRWCDQGSSQKYDYANDHEFSFLHSGDPSSASIYQTSGSIVLHWLKDRRYIKLYRLNGSSPSGAINYYRIMRKVGEGAFNEYATVGGSTTFVDTDPNLASGTRYSYRIESLKSGSQYLEYSGELSVVYGIPDQRAYWLEELYHTWTPPSTPTDEELFEQFKNGVRDLEIQVAIGAYQPIDQSVRQLKAYCTYPSAEADSVSAILNFSGSQISGTYWRYELSHDPAVNFSDNCGFACLFRDETSGVAEILGGYYHNTDVNNRIANSDFPTYRLDPRSADAVGAWLTEARYCMGLAGEYAAPPGRYDAMFGDSIEPDFSFANVYPDWIHDSGNNLSLYRDSFIDYVAVLNDSISSYSPSLQFCANWWWVSGWEEMQVALDGAMVENFATDWEAMGNDDYSVFSEGRWYSQLSMVAHMLDYNQTESLETDIYLLAEASTGNASSLWERLWSFASYLLVADGNHVHFGHRGICYSDQHDDRSENWGYFPEMQINLGEPDPSYVMPKYSLPDSVYLGKSTSNSTVPTGVNQHHLRRFEHGVVLVNSAYSTGSSGTMSYTVGDGDSCVYMLMIDDKHILDGGRLWTRQVPEDTILTLEDGEAFILLDNPYASPEFDKEFTTFIYRDQPGEVIRAKATSWNGDPMWFEVDADTLDLESPMILSAGQVLYESASFTCSAPAGTYPLPVYIRDDSGFALYDTLWVEVVEPPALVAKYVNKSTSVVGLDYPGIPYSEITLDYDNDGREDLLVTLQANSPRLFRNAYDGNNGVPVFEFIEDALDAEIDSLQSARGCAAADYDNDGYVDLFIAHETHPMLLRNLGPGNTPRFENDGHLLNYQTITIVGQDTITETHNAFETSWAGSWGDMNNDGKVDLLVTRADASGATKLAGTHDHLPFVLLMNDSAPEQTAFAMMPLLFGSNETSPITASSASWADVDVDGWLDLFLPSLGDPADTRLYHRTAQSYYADEFAARFPGVDLGGVDAAVWADLNRDGLPDMISTERGGSFSTGDRLRLFMNDAGAPGHFIDCTAWADTTGPTTDLRPVDLDLDGWIDLVAVADETTSQPGIHLLRNTGDAGLAGGFPYFKDVSAEIGFAADSERVSGLAAADFLGDGDVDLLMGRELSHDTFYFSAVAADGATEPPSSHWLGVRLAVGSGANNRSGIGAVVTVETSSASTMQVVDGGSGLGGQQSASLRFGLGDAASAVTVRTRWPGGFEQDTTFTNVDTVVTIPDETDPTVIESSLQRSVYYSPNKTLIWDITWETAFSYAPELDRVRITVPTRSPRIYTPDDENVIVTTGRTSSGGYWHRFIISGVICHSGEYTYSVTSDTQSPQYTEHTTATGSYMSNFCARDGGDPNVED